MTTSTTYHCPLCGGAKIHQEFDEPLRLLRGGRVIVETPLGKAVRIEAILVDHMLHLHGLSVEDAVEKLRAMA